MVKSGSFKVGQGSTAGRVGAGLGKGLAESIPKEVNQYRLSQGLQNFAKNAQNLSPLEAASQAFSIPGITPQMAQALPELLRLQQQRQAYQNRGQQSQQGNETPQEQPEFRQGGLSSQGNEPRNMQSQSQMVKPDEFGQPQIVQDNPLRVSAVPRESYSPERFDQEVSDMLDSGKAQTVNEAIGLVKEKEARYLGQPLSVQKMDDYFREQETLLNSNLEKRLKTLLEVGPQEQGLKNLSGEEFNNLQRSANKELRTNPRATQEDIANKYANIGLELDKTKGRLQKLAGEGFIDKLTSRDKTLDKLKSYQKIFAESNSEENYFNNLKSDFGLSPLSAASIAFPLSKSVDSQIKDWKPSKNLTLENAAKSSRQLATQIEKSLGDNDSILSIANEIMKKSHNTLQPGTPAFDIHEFYNQLREDQDQLGLNPRQKREIAEGIGSGLPTWSDILYMPWRK